MAEAVKIPTPLQALRLTLVQAEPQLQFLLEITTPVPFLTTATSSAGDGTTMERWAMGELLALIQQTR